MTERVLVSTVAIGLFVSATLGSQAPKPSESTPRAAGAQVIPRMADGKPDWNGVWQGGSARRGAWAEANSGLGVGGTGRDPAAPSNVVSGQIPSAPAPYQPWAAQKVLEAFNRRGIDDPTGLCLPAGLPRSTLVGLFPMQIIQTTQQIVVLYEYMNTFRVIPLTAKHPDDVVPSYMGDSVGHWEGDILVVDVTGFNDKTWLTGTGTFHSDQLHITERYTPVDRERIDYQVTIEDPMVLTGPWVIDSSIMRREGTRLQEYICAENNLDPGRYEKLLKEGVKFTR